MPVRYDPILTREVAAELRGRLGRRRAEELRLDRDRRLASLCFRSGPGLLFLLHPEAGQLVESDRPPGETRLGLRGLRVGGVEAPADERLLALDLPPAGPEGTPHRVVVELLTNQWNLLLLRETGVPPQPEGAGDDADGRGGGRSKDGPRWTIRAALWRREPGDRVLRAGEPYRAPEGSRRWRERLPSAEEWEELLGPVPPDDLRSAALRNVAWLSSLNVDWVLGPATSAAAGPPALERALERYRELRRGEGRPWLLRRSWGLQPYVRRLGDDGAEEAPSLLAGMVRSLETEGDWARVAGLEAAGGEEPRPVETPELAELRDALEDRASRLRRRVEALERELEEGEDPEELRATADLLLARLDRVPRGAREVRLEGFDGGEREVELDPSLAPSENADRYYEEAARRERALEKLPREIEEAERRVRRVETARRGLEEAEEPPGEEAVEELWELAGGRPDTGDGAPEEKLPYRRLRTSGGLELRVGKGAKSNEELTFHHSHTEDVWLHARQVPGAHVILRWGRTDENPPRRDLVEAAVVAAVNSKARHSGSVAVDWTRRKYVRSPRKSAPGVVIPRNIETIFVEPDEGLVKRLERRAAGGGG
jgi:hypothetical protein